MSPSAGRRPRPPAPTSSAPTSTPIATGQIAVGEVGTVAARAARRPRRRPRSRPRSGTGSSGRCASCPAAAGRPTSAEARYTVPTIQGGNSSTPTTSGSSERLTSSVSRRTSTRSGKISHSHERGGQRGRRRTTADAGDRDRRDRRSATGIHSTAEQRAAARRRPAGRPAGWSARGHCRPGQRARTSLTHRRPWASPAAVAEGAAGLLRIAGQNWRLRRCRSKTLPVQRRRVTLRRPSGRQQLW